MHCPGSRCKAAKWWQMQRTLMLTTHKNLDTVQRGIKQTGNHNLKRRYKLTINLSRQRGEYVVQLSVYSVLYDIHRARCGQRPFFSLCTLQTVHPFMSLCDCCAVRRLVKPSKPQRPHILSAPPCGLHAPPYREAASWTIKAGLELQCADADAQRQK